jgi:hypothetical protein
MATILLGAVGAGVGSLVGGPAGARWGWSIGTTIGSFVDAGNMPNQEFGKLSDRRFSGAQYGSSIPWCWGRARTGGTIIWMDEDASGNHLVERRVDSGGKKGGGASSSTYYYTATFAVAICLGEVVFPDGTSEFRPREIEKVWANDVLVYDVDAASNVLTLGDNLIWHDGADDQAPSSVIIARDGTTSDDTVAYRGIAYLTIEDMDLSDFGNAVPSFSVLTRAVDAVTSGEIYSDLARIAGLTESQIDATAGTAEVRGFAVADLGAPSDAIETFLEFVDLDHVEVDGTAKLGARGGSPVLTIPFEDLGAGIDGPGDRWQATREQESEMPGRVEIQYYGEETNLEAATQSDVNPVGDSLDDRTLSVPFTLTAAEAKAKVQREIDGSFEARLTGAASTLPRYKKLCPGDSVLVEVRRDVTQRFRITQMRTSGFGPISLSLVKERGSQFVQSGSGGSSGDSGDLPSGAASASLFTAWSGREIRDADQSAAGFYVAANGDEAWRGGQVYYSRDGSTWIPGPFVGGRATFGEATSALSDSGAVADAYDDTNDVDVDVTASGGQLISVSDDANAAGINGARLGDELIMVGTATVGSPGEYTLSHIGRGLRGTPMTGHSIGDKFVLLSSAVKRVSVSEDWVGDTVQVRVVSPGQAIGDVTSVNVVIAARTPTATEDVAAAALTYVPLAPSVVDSDTSGTRAAVAWTTFDASAVLPAGTLFAEVQAVATDSGTSGAGLQAIDVRKDGSGAVYSVVEGTIITADSDLSLVGTLRVAVTTAREFDYRVRVGFLDGWELRIIGAWKPVA